MTEPSAKMYYEIQGRNTSPPSEWFEIMRMHDGRSEESALERLDQERKAPNVYGTEHRLVRVQTLVVIYPVEEETDD